MLDSDLLPEEDLNGRDQELLEAHPECQLLCASSQSTTFCNMFQRYHRDSRVFLLQDNLAHRQDKVLDQPWLRGG